MTNELRAKIEAAPFVKDVVASNGRFYSGRFVNVEDMLALIPVEPECMHPFCGDKCGTPAPQETAGEECNWCNGGGVQHSPGRNGDPMDNGVTCHVCAGSGILEVDPVSNENQQESHHPRHDITDDVIAQWAAERADDAGALARRILALISELSAMKADRPYIIGCLHGWDAAMEERGYPTPAAAPTDNTTLLEAVESHLKWFERFICDREELDSSTPRKVARNAQDAAAELRAALSTRPAEATSREGDAEVDRFSPCAHALDEKWIKMRPDPNGNWVHINEVTALQAERDALRSAIFGGYNYSPDLKNGNFVEMARDTEAGRKFALSREKEARARIEALEGALRDALLWTDEEYDVKEWRSNAGAALTGDKP